MRDFAEAKGGAEKDGTAKVEKFRATARKTIMGFTWLVAIGFATYHFAQWLKEPAKAPPPPVSQRAPAQRQALPQDAPDLPWAWKTEKSKWPRVHVPAHGDSVRVPAVFGGHVVWGGSGFKVHCVYAGGREGVVGDPAKPCTDGDIVESYVRNDGDTPIYAAYAYARSNEK